MQCTTDKISLRKEYQRNYWASERGKEVHRLYNSKNKEKKNMRQRAWRLKNKEKYLEYARKYYRTEKGKLRDKAQHHNRRIRSKGLKVKTIQQVYEENIKQYGTLTCELCMNKIDFGNDNLEHFTPLSRGGTNERYNLGVAHSTCNKVKGNKTLEEYKKWQC